MGKWWIPLVGGLGTLVLLPFIFMGVRSGWEGPGYLYVGVPLALLLVGLGIAGSWMPGAKAPRGLPAPFGSPPYGFKRELGGGGFRSSLRDADPRMRRMHQALLWLPVAAVAFAALLVLPAILVGPKGVAAVGSGLGILVGAPFLVAAYALAAYRALVPTAVAMGLWGLLIEAQAVADAWGFARTWDAWALVLVLAIVPVQALAAEAAFRVHPRPFWAAWTGLGTLMGVAYPMWLFFGEPGSGQVPLALSLASLVWGVAANFAFAPLPQGMRWAGVGVFAVWAATLVYGYGAGTDLGDRLKAAGLVAAAAYTAIAFVAYYVGKATARQETPDASH